MNDFRDQYIQALIAVIATHPSEALFDRIERLLDSGSALPSEGSIYQRTDGRWVGQWLEGQQKRYVYGHTRGEAERRMAAAKETPTPTNEGGVPPNYVPEPTNSEPLPGDDPAIEIELEPNDEQLAETLVIHSIAANEAPPEPKRKPGICPRCGHHTRSFAHAEACNPGLRAPSNANKSAEKLALPAEDKAPLVFPPAEVEPVAPPANFTPEPKTEIAPLKSGEELCAEGAHYWLIDPPNGEASDATCKRCGVKKSFYNSFDSAEAGGANVWNHKARTTAMV